MPCQGGPSWEDSERELRDRNIMSRLACDRCKFLERTTGVPEWARAWWESHKAEDRKRLEENKQAKKEAKIRERALAKLTEEEKEQLGL